MSNDRRSLKCVCVCYSEAVKKWKAQISIDRKQCTLVNEEELQLIIHEYGLVLIHNIKK